MKSPYLKLYELMKETTKPAPQYANVQESTKFIKEDDKKWSLYKNVKFWLFSI